MLNERKSMVKAKKISRRTARRMPLQYIPSLYASTAITSNCMPPSTLSTPTAQALRW